MSLDEQFGRANRRARQLRASQPTALSARYDQRNGRIVIGLSSGLEVGFLPEHAQGLDKASPRELGKIEISPSGYGIHFPKLDADLYLPALLEGVFGSKRWMAARLGRLGGLSRSRGKIAASRKNGKLGGRPRKTALRTPSINPALRIAAKKKPHP
jgi:hypothetical protein